MRYPQTQPAFSEEEFVKAHAFLASRVATMMGRKFEEGDWSFVYCAAKGLPESGWSNLRIDIMHESLGVEHKMLCVRSKKRMKEHCGTTLMHPSATRSIRIPSTIGDPTETARDVLDQYVELIQQHRQRVTENAPGNTPDMRIGWLLWQVSLREFMYFEVEMLEPNPDDYWAEWVESKGGSRKASKNLWVYEIETGKKRYSITTSGPKIQPYFDVPAPNDPNLYHFRVQGEKLDGDLIRIWITSTTALLLENLLGEFDTDTISSVITKTAAKVSEIEETSKETPTTKLDLAKPICLTIDAYRALTETFVGVSDEHMIQLFLRHISQRA